MKINENAPSTIDRINYERSTNQAKNDIATISRSFLSLAYVLKEIRDKGYYNVEYESFEKYCEKELDIASSTAYDYVNVAMFVEDNLEYLTLEKAQILGQTKLRILSAKLSSLERKFRKLVLKKIDENISSRKIEEQLDILIKSLRVKK